MPRFEHLFLGALLSITACGDDGGGVSDAEGQKLCEDACDKTDECAPGIIDLAQCKAQCQPSGSDTDGNDCTPAEEQEIVNHIKGCLDLACAEYVQCASETPTCG